MYAHDVLKYGHIVVLESIDGLHHEDWLTPNVCGVWTVREIIAHLASFEHLLVDILGQILDDAPTPTMNRFLEEGNERFNDLEVAERQNRSVDEVRAEYEQTYEKTAALLARLPVEMHRRSGIFRWYGEEYDLEDVLVYSYYGHKREHCAQINVFRDTLPY